jgi:transposase
MPWSETSTVDQKRLFVADYQRRSFAMAELCRRYGVSRPTGYKWIQRFEGEGFPGLTERSKRPKGCSHETAIEITEAVSGNSPLPDPGEAHSHGTSARRRRVFSHKRFYDQNSSTT